MRCDPPASIDLSQYYTKSQVDSANSAQDSRLTALESSDSSQNTRISSLETTASSQGTKITALETQTSSLESADATLSSQISAVDSKLSSYLPLTGGTLTDVLKVGSSGAVIRPNGYVEGSWLKTTAATATTDTSKIAVIKEGWIYYVTPATLKGALGVESHDGVTATLTVAGWTGSGPYTQTLNATGVTASNDVFVAVASSATDQQWLEAGSQVVRATAQGAGTVTFSASYKPTVNIPIVMKVLV